MKKVFCILAILFFSLIVQSLAGESNERTFINSAARQAANERKLLVIEFWSPSCGPCLAMKRDIFENSMHTAYVHKYFHVIKVSPSDSIYKSLWKYFKLQYQSSIIYMDRHGNEMDRTVGYNGERDAYLELMKDFAHGKNLYREIVRKYRRDSLNVANCCLMARKLTSRYETDEAARLYTKILSRDPEDRHGLRAECLYRIAEMELMRTGNLARMREFVERGPNNPFAPRAYVYLINDLIGKKNKTECLAICTAGLSRYPDSWEILNKYAWAICSFKVQEEYPKALSMVQKSIALNPSRPGTYSTQAWIHFEMGDKAQAVRLQKKAIEIFPDRGFMQDLEAFEKK